MRFSLQLLSAALIGVVATGAVALVMLRRVPLVILAALALIVISMCLLMVRRAGGVLAVSKSTLHTRKPSRTARYAEAVLIAAGGLFMLLFVWCDMGLHVPDWANPRDRVYAGWLGGTLLIGLFALILGLRGRGSVAAVVLGLGIAGGSALAAWAMPARGSVVRGGVARYVLELEDASGLPAEVWVNGVHLGRLPLVMPAAEFIQRVPLSTTVPSEAEDVVEVMQYHPEYPYRRKEHRLIEFELRAPPKNWIDDGPSSTCFAEFRLGDEVGYGRWGGGSSGGSGEGWTARVGFNVTFPGVNQRLETLLDQVRLADYRASTDWLLAMESFERLARTCLRDAAEREPDLLQVWDQWARWQYRLDEVRDADNAWSNLMAICQEADEQDHYFTADLAGRAVELLVPLLDAKQLARQAVERIQAVSSVRYTQQSKYGRIQFGSGERLASRQSGHFDRLSGSARSTPGDFALAHAVWVKHEELSRAGGPQNVLQCEAGAALICWRYPWDDAIRAADALDWPGLDTFLLRQNWSAPIGRGQGYAWEDRLFVNGRDVNKWLYFLAQRQSPAAATFRTQHRRELTALADALLENRITFDIPGFLFHDVASGSRCLAAEYWPRFRAHLLTPPVHQPHQLAKLWEYLVKMEPASTPAMYAECWRDAAEPETWHHDAVAVLRRLPLARRQEVVKAVLAEVQHEWPERSSGRNQVEQQRMAEHSLASCLTEPELAEAERIMESLVSGQDREKLLKRTGDWLEFERPDHPVVGQLVASPDPAVRALALRAIRAHPTPEHRRLLARLLATDDAGLRRAAEEVQTALGALAMQPASKSALSSHMR